MTPSLGWRIIEGSRGTPVHMLFGVNCLVVEDQYLIALEIQRVLEAAGARVSVVLDLSEAPSADSPDLRLALVSIGPESVAAIEFCRLLHEKGVAIVAVTADAEHQQGIPGLDNVEILLKPFTDDELAAAATAAMLRAERPPALT